MLKLFLMIVLIGIISACNVLDSDSKRYWPIEGPINFSLTEGYMNWGEVSDPEIILFMETEKFYGCDNYSIHANVSLENTTINVNLLSIFHPIICLKSWLIFASG